MGERTIIVDETIGKEALCIVLSMAQSALETGYRGYAHEYRVSGDLAKQINDLHRRCMTSTPPKEGE